MACDFTLCLAGGNLPDFEAWSGTLRGLVDIGVVADSCDLRIGGSATAAAPATGPGWLARNRLLRGQNLPLALQKKVAEALHQSPSYIARSSGVAEREFAGRYATGMVP